MSNYISRREYVNTFCPTVGDRVRLADTDLFIEVERDLTTYGGTHYGDEVKFGGGKVIRDGMGQSPISNADGAVDLVITNVLILDWWGIVKADVGIKDGRIAEIGKAGNPHTQDEIDFLCTARPLQLPFYRKENIQEAIQNIVPETNEQMRCHME